MVRGPDGQVSVPVEVDAFTPPPPPPPLVIPIEPITTPSAEPQLAPSRPPPPSGAEPAGEGDTFTPEDFDRAFDGGWDDLARLPDLGTEEPSPSPPDADAIDSAAGQTDPNVIDNGEDGQGGGSARSGAPLPSARARGPL
jgi:hypothetical protein